MTPVTRWLLRAGLIWFLAAAAGILAASLSDPAYSRSLTLMAWHMLVMGWITQVIIGVSLWMFPRPASGFRDRENWRTWSLFWLLNLGLLLRFVSEPFVQIGDPGVWAASLLFLSIPMQLGASILYVLEIWPRVRGKKRKRRR